MNKAIPKEVVCLPTKERQKEQWHYRINPDSGETEFWNHYSGKWVKSPRPPQKGRSRTKLTQDIASNKYLEWRELDAVVDAVVDALEIAVDNSIDKSYWRTRTCLIIHALFERQSVLSCRTKAILSEVKPFYYPVKKLEYLGGDHLWLILRILRRFKVITFKKWKQNVYLRPLYIFKIIPELDPRSATTVRITDVAIDNSFRLFLKARSKSLGAVHKKMFDANLKHLTINLDYSEWIWLLIPRFNKENLLRRVEGKPEITFEEYERIMAGQWHQKEKWNNAERPEDRISGCSVDGFAGRFHFLVSSLLKESRQHLCFDGNPLELVEIDMKCCQPTLAANMLVKEYGVSPNECKFIRHVMDFKHDIYMRIAEERWETRDNAKDHMMVWMFCPVQSPNQVIFEQHYPVAGKIFGKIKSERCYKIMPDGSKRKEASYKRLCQRLQQMEVHLFTQVWLALLDQGIFFIPVHDAVYVRKEDEEKARKIVTKVFQNNLKFFKLS